MKATKKKTKKKNTTHLIDKKRGHKLSRLENLHHLADQVVIRRLGEVGFKADIGELRLRCDVDGPVSSLGRPMQAQRATLHETLERIAAATRAKTGDNSRRSSCHSLSSHMG